MQVEKLKTIDADTLLSTPMRKTLFVMYFISAWRIPTHEYKAACIKSQTKHRPNFALQQRVFKSPTAWNSKSNSIFPTFRKQNLSLSTPFKRFEIQKAPAEKAECMQATTTM